MGLQLETCLNENPGIRGIVLGSHGVFTWGDTSYESYINSLEVIEVASQYIEDKITERGAVFGGQKMTSLEKTKRTLQASILAPILRGLCSSEQNMIGHFTDDPKVLEYINSNDLRRLAPMGTSCPDHFLRTKIKPLILALNPEEDLTNPSEVLKKITPSFEQYRKDYQQYYDACKHSDSPDIRDANPVVILYPGVGMFTFAKNKQTARVASEFYINAVNVMRGAEAISKYTALPRQEAFDIEYWLLEEAKLQRQPKEKPLSRKVALITGSGGGIGRAIADKLITEGANVVFTDISEDYLKEATAQYSPDQAIACKCDVTSAESIASAIQKASLQFGGLDIVVHSAGLAISKPGTSSECEKVMAGEFIGWATGKDMESMRLDEGIYDIARQSSASNPKFTSLMPDDFNEAVKATSPKTSLLIWKIPEWPAIGDELGLVLEELFSGTRSDIQGSLDEVQEYAIKYLEKSK